MNEISKNLVALVGPPCSGKSTILKKLLELYPNEFDVPRSLTTRAPREGEVGNEYEFVSQNEFFAQREKNKLLEWTCYCGNFYGMSKKAVLDVVASGRIPIRAMDIVGAKNLGCFSIYVDRKLDDMIAALYDRCADQKKLFIERLVQIYNDMLVQSYCSRVVSNKLVDETVHEVYQMIQENVSKTVFGSFSSVWLDGSVITTTCRIDPATKKVFDIQVSPSESPDCSLLREFVTIDGDNFPVFQKKEAEEGAFWYD